MTADRYAEYYAAKPWPRTDYQSSDADVAAGERIATSGMCTQCHLGGFLGDGTIPHIGGQTETYLHKTMLDFKTRARANNPDKSTLLASSVIAGVEPIFQSASPRQAQSLGDWGNSLSGGAMDMAGGQP